MSFSFDASKTQPSAANPATPATGSTGFAIGQNAGGAAEPGKLMAGGGFSLASMQPQGKPGGSIFGSSLGVTQSAPTFGSSGMQIGGGLTLGAAASGNTTSAPATNLTFGTPSAATPGTALNFGAGAPGSTAPVLSFGLPKPATTAPASSGFSLGGNVAANTANQAPKLNFGGGSVAPANTGFTLGAAAPAAAATSASTVATGFSLSTPAATTTQSALAPTSAAGTGFSLTSLGAQPLAASGFGLGQSSTAATAAGTATTASTAFSLGLAPGTSATTTSANVGFNLSNIGGSTPSLLSTGFSLNKTTTTPAATTAVASIASTATTSATAISTTTTAQPASTTAIGNAPQTTLGSVTTVSSASSVQAGSMNFCQLEESINKWTLELEEQEKAFVNQATQVNAWNKLLIANGEKIATLNQEVERVKTEQQQLEHELDYVVGQQKELEDCLVPLEKELASLSVADPEREYTYRLAENLDKQLKQMSQDLKEIIEHLNEANRSQDSSDPIVQIGKILNAHMNSLLWLDQRTCVIGHKIQQIDQMHQHFRQENERSFNLAYN